MSENANKETIEEVIGETTGSGENAPEPDGATEKVDERIAPSSPRDEEGQAPHDSADTTDDASEGPAKRLPRPSVRAVAAGVIACAVALCAVGAGVGYATGWFGGAPAVEPISAAVQPSDPSSGDESDRAAGADASQPEDDAEEPAATDDPEASEPDAAKSPSASEAAASAEPASVEDAPAPAPESSPSESAATQSQPEPAPAPDPQPEPAPEPEAPAAPSTVTVSVYIDSSRATSHGYPSSLGGGTVTLNQGASVYDALCATGAAVGGSSSYVSSIGGLAEFACGSGSGWLYFVNGSSPGYGCGSYILSGGESITWVYTCDMGNDL